MCEMDPSKLIRAYDEGYIDPLCIRVILNQVRSKYSLFFKTHRRKGFTGSHILHDTRSEIPDDLLGIINDRPSLLSTLTGASLDYHKENSPSDQEYEITGGQFPMDPEEIQEIADEDEPGDPITNEEDVIERITRRISELVMGLHWYDKHLWKMKYEQGISLKDISATTGINYNSVYYNINKTKEGIRKTIRKEFPGSIF